VLTRFAPLIGETLVLGSQNKGPVRLPMRLASALAVLIVSAPAIAQQASTLVADLRKGVPCQTSGARPAMDANIGKATAAAAEIDAALTEINANTTICNALRDAAAEIGKARAGAAATGASADVPQGLSQASRDAVAAALAQAERNVANLKFEVGPPPPIAAKGRNSGP
jgi:hypothetical protein